jgi:hypothetical protein
VCLLHARYSSHFEIKYMKKSVSPLIEYLESAGEWQNTLLLLIVSESSSNEDNHVGSACLDGGYIDAHPMEFASWR